MTESAKLQAVVSDLWLPTAVLIAITLAAWFVIVPDLKERNPALAQKVELVIAGAFLATFLVMLALRLAALPE